ncbi:hypothetical protein BJX65DRAFT_142816 [Aspergillus insuetus]
MHFGVDSPSFAGTPSWRAPSRPMDGRAGSSLALNRFSQTSAVSQSGRMENLENFDQKLDSRKGKPRLPALSAHDDNATRSSMHSGTNSSPANTLHSVFQRSCLCFNSVKTAWLLPEVRLWCRRVSAPESELNSGSHNTNWPRTGRKCFNCVPGANMFQDYDNRPGPVFSLAGPVAIV